MSPLPADQSPGLPSDFAVWLGLLLGSLKLPAFPSLDFLHRGPDMILSPLGPRGSCFRPPPTAFMATCPVFGFCDWLGSRARVHGRERGHVPLRLVCSLAVLGEGTWLDPKPRATVPDSEVGLRGETEMGSASQPSFSQTSGRGFMNIHKLI